jgi:catechol 2,3-dioxygenase-like lactoylglutathione lyase family enzyme
MTPKIKGILFTGIKTDKFNELRTFFGQTLGLEADHDEPGFATYPLANGDKIEIYGPNDPNAPNHDHFVTGPVVGFEVDDIVEMKKDMEAQGISFIGDIQSARPGGSQWAHFRGPDGNIYELKQKAPF